MPEDSRQSEPHGQFTRKSAAKESSKKSGNFFWRTSICRSLPNCPVGKDCRFAHSKQELQHTQDVYKTSLCWTEFRKIGKCKMGDFCRYAHSKQELQQYLSRRDESSNFCFQSSSSSDGLSAAILPNANVRRCPDADELEEANLVAGLRTLSECSPASPVVSHSPPLARRPLPASEHNYRACEQETLYDVKQVRPSQIRTGAAVGAGGFSTPECFTPTPPPRSFQPAEVAIRWLTVVSEIHQEIHESMSQLTLLANALGRIGTIEVSLCDTRDPYSLSSQFLSSEEFRNAIQVALSKALSSLQEVDTLIEAGLGSTIAPPPPPPGNQHAVSFSNGCRDNMKMKLKERESAFQIASDAAPGQYGNISCRTTRSQPSENTANGSFSDLSPTSSFHRTSSNISVPFLPNKDEFSNFRNSSTNRQSLNINGNRNRDNRCRSGQNLRTTRSTDNYADDDTGDENFADESDSQDRLDSDPLGITSGFLE